VDACLQASASFPVGVAARSHVKLSNNPTTDSYNSATNQAAFARPDYTNATGYVLANGDIATNGSITNDDDIVVNGNVHGRALTGPNGTVSLGGYIGPFLDQAQQTTSISVAETNGWVRHDFAVDFPLPNLPANFNPVTLSGTTLGNGDYTATSLGNSDYTVTGNARLRLTGTGTVINFSGQKGITIQPGGRLEIYTYGNVDLTGQAAINNNTKKPAYCLIYGMGTCSNINVKGNGQIATAIYAPNAAIQWQGAGSKSDFYGGMIGRSVDFQGSVHMDFHYDESLRDLNGTGGRTINSWKSWRYTGSTWVQD
jgi:hypothetical protein